MKKIIAGLFAIAAFSFSAVAQNQNTEGQKQWRKEGRGHHNKHKDGEMRGMEQLNLTEAQRAQIKAINQDFTTRLHALNQNDNLLVKDAKAQRKALMEERKNRTYSVLTAEQKAKFEQMRKDHGDKHKEHGDKHKEHGDRYKENGDRYKENGDKDKGDFKNKSKGDDWKQKRKGDDGKEKIKVKES